MLAHSLPKHSIVLLSLYHPNLNLVQSVKQSMKSSLVESYSAPDCTSSVSTQLKHTMNESKFLIYGEFIRPNGYQNYDILGYIAPTREDAIANCRRNNPQFHIITVREEN